jgi:DNA-binding GntR family transcriptional regulator
MPASTRAPLDNAKFSTVVTRCSAGLTSVRQLTYEVLRAAILGGVFAPGEWLRQPEVAKAIGVSRTSVRTALLRLEAEGLITLTPHRGARIIDRATALERG